MTSLSNDSVPFWDHRYNLLKVHTVKLYLQETPIPKRAAVQDLEKTWKRWNKKRKEPDRRPLLEALRDAGLLAPEVPLTLSRKNKMFEEPYPLELRAGKIIIKDFNILEDYIR